MSQVNNYGKAPKAVAESAYLQWTTNTNRRFTNERRRKLLRRRSSSYLDSNPCHVLNVSGRNGVTLARVWCGEVDEGDPRVRGIDQDGGPEDPRVKSVTLDWKKIRFELKTFHWIVDFYREGRITVWLVFSLAGLDLTNKEICCCLHIVKLHNPI